MESAVLDDIINRLLEYRHVKAGKQVQIMESEIRQLCTVSREIFLQQPNLLELEAPIKICGVFSWSNFVFFHKNNSFVFSISNSLVIVVIFFLCGWVSGILDYVGFDWMIVLSDYKAFRTLGV